MTQVQIDKKTGAAVYKKQNLCVKYCCAALECRYLIWYFCIFFVLPVGLVTCGTFVPWYFFTHSLPRYQDYRNEERHHVQTTCDSITSTFVGKFSSAIYHALKTLICHHSK